MLVYYWSMAEILKFNKFKMEDLSNKKIVIIGRTGKSWLVRDILHHIQDIPRGVVIAPTDRMTNFYENMFPSLTIYHEYDTHILSRLLKKQREILDGNREKINKGEEPVDPRAFLIMDDCMSSNHLWLKDPNLVKIIYEARHYHLTFILTMLYPLSIQPELRANFDYVFLFGEDFISNKKKLYERYAGMFPTKELFFKVFNSLTEYYNCMVTNNRLRSNDIYKKVFHYKAEKRELVLDTVSAIEEDTEFTDIEWTDSSSMLTDSEDM